MAIVQMRVLRCSLLVCAIYAGATAMDDPEPNPFTSAFWALCCSAFVLTDTRGL